MNFEKVIQSIPNKSTVIFILGEIDCREGIIGSVEKCKYDSVQESIKFTADIYLNTLNNLKITREFNPIIHPVVPVIDITRIYVLSFNDYLRQQKVIKYLDFGDLLLENDRKDFNKKYELDGTHLSPVYLYLLESYFK